MGRYEYLQIFDNSFPFLLKCLYLVNQFWFATDVEENMLSNLSKIKVENPVDLIISQIRELISTGAVKPGEKLPPERKLAEHLGASRGQVREAISRLEIYGILKVQPQSGTTVAGLGIVALEGLITDILKIEKADFKSLVDTRVLLEKESARLAAIHRTPEDLIQLNIALEKFENKVNSGDSAIEEDLMFHLQIAEASRNSVLKSFMMIITPDIVNSFNTYKVCDTTQPITTLEEHRRIYNCIVEQDEKGVVEAMENHLSEVVNFSKDSAQK